MDTTGKFHAHALGYFGLIKNPSTTLYISTLAVSEYQFRGDIEVVIDMTGARLLSYDFRHAAAYPEAAKKHHWIYDQKKPDRTALVVDLMMVVQAQVMGIDGFITGDKRLITNFLSGSDIQALDITRSTVELAPLYAPSDESAPVVPTPDEDGEDSAQRLN
ncbi:hypothetical protein [Deinococcus grandis]|nr:hypothetical protein [Deinococcus grandis]